MYVSVWKIVTSRCLLIPSIFLFVQKYMTKKRAPPPRQRKKFVLALLSTDQHFFSCRFCFYSGFVNFVIILFLFFTVFWNIVLVFRSCSLLRFIWFSVLILVSVCSSTTQSPKFLKIWLKIIKSVKKLLNTKASP